MTGTHALAREGGRRSALRAGMLLGSAVVGGGLAMTSPDPVGPALLLLGASAVIAATRPDSPAVVVHLLALAVAWITLVPRPERPQDLLLALLAAIAVLAIHLCAAALSVWPPGTAVPHLARVRWWRRAGAVALALLVATALAAQLMIVAPGGHRLLSLLAVIGVNAAALAGYHWSGPGHERDGGAE